MEMEMERGSKTDKIYTIIYMKWPINQANTPSGTWLAICVDKCQEIKAITRPGIRTKSPPRTTGGNAKRKSRKHVESSVLPQKLSPPKNHPSHPSHPSHPLPGNPLKFQPKNQKRKKNYIHVYTNTPTLPHTHTHTRSDFYVISKD